MEIQFCVGGKMKSNAFEILKLRQKAPEKGGCQTEGCLAIMKKVYSNSIKMKY